MTSTWGGVLATSTDKESVVDEEEDEDEEECPRTRGEER